MSSKVTRISSSLIRGAQDAVLRTPSAHTSRKLGSIFTSATQTYSTSASVYAKPSKFWSILEKPKDVSRDYDFPEVEEELDADGDLPELEDEEPKSVFVPKQNLPTESLAKTALRILRGPEKKLAAPIVHAFKDIEEMTVVKARAFAEISEETLSVTPPKRSFWDTLWKGFKAICAAFAFLGSLVAYYAFPFAPKSSAKEGL
jgi:hypothetical protein